MFPVTVSVITVPYRTHRGLDFKKRVDDFHGVDNARIVCFSQAETDQRQGIRTDDLGNRLFALTNRTILNGDEPRSRRSCVSLFGRSDADIITLNTHLVSKV